MTLTTRNTLTRIFSIFALAGTICILTVITVTTVSNKLSFPESSFSIHQDISGLFLQKSPEIASLAVVLFCLYASITGFILYFNFIKTNAPEILYFTGFLGGCFLESARLVIPLFNLWTVHTSLLLISARLLFLGEIASIIFLLSIGLSSSSSDAQDSERNLLIIIITALFFTALVPVNPTNIAISMRVKTGFASTVNTTRIVFILASAISIYVRGARESINYYKKAAFDFLCIGIGYTISIFACSPLQVLIGGLLLGIFTTRYLKNIHSYYIWN